MTETSYDPGGLIAGDFPVAHRTVTIGTAADLVRGAVLGRITGSDKYVLSATAAGDGSEVPVAVLAADAAAAAADVVAPVYFAGEFAADQLTFGAGHDADSVDASTRQNGLSIFIRQRV